MTFFERSHFLIFFAFALFYFILLSNCKTGCLFMKKRKKLLKLFRNIESFIKEEEINTNAYTFLLNKFYLSTHNLRATGETLAGIPKSDFLKINKKFDDRLKKHFTASLSISYILTLPTDTPQKAEISDKQSNSSILFLSPHIYLPYNMEKENSLVFAYTPEQNISSPFKNITFTPIKKNSPVIISLQATLFDVINKESLQILPGSFDYILDESIADSFPTPEFSKNIYELLKEKGLYILNVKKNFLRSSLRKKEKKSLYNLFAVKQIDKTVDYIKLSFTRLDEQKNTFEICNHKTSSSITVDYSFLTFNNLLTFNDNITQSQLNLIDKIESKAESVCGDYFKFFIGMFPGSGKRPVIETLRKSSRFKPFVRANNITPFCPPSVSSWIIPDKDCFFQIPPADNFDSDKLLLRFLSTKPVCTHDNNGIYFLNDIAAILPKKNDVMLEYAEGYFNSSLIRFYYMMRFPQHNKFLKKHFNKIPFFSCSKNIQKIIQQSVLKLRSLHSGSATSIFKDENHNIINKEISTLDNYIFQLFKLNQEEINIVNNFLSEHKV